MEFNATGTTAMAAWLLKRQFGKLLQGSFLGAPVLRANLRATEAKKSIFEVEYPGYFGVRLPSGGAWTDNKWAQKQKKTPAWPLRTEFFVENYFWG